MHDKSLSCGGDNVEQKKWINFILSIAQQPTSSRSFSLSRLHDHTQTHHTQQDSSGRVISLTQRPLPHNTKKKTDIRAPGGIRTRNPSKRAAADPRLTLHGHWDRHNKQISMTSVERQYKRNKQRILTIFWLQNIDSEVTERMFLNASYFVFPD